MGWRLETGDWSQKVLRAPAERQAPHCASAYIRGVEMLAPAPRHQPPGGLHGAQA